MKKVILSLFLVSSLVLMVGCSNQADDIDDPSPQEEVEVVDPVTENNEETQDSTKEIQTNMINIQVGDNTMTATLVDNSSTAALKDMLADGPVTIDMRDYGNMEKVGAFPTSLPRNDVQITTEPGDLILYQGSAFVIYYAPNSWNFTKLGKINDITAPELKKVLGNGSVSVTLSLAE